MSRHDVRKAYVRTYAKEKGHSAPYDDFDGDSILHRIRAHVDPNETIWQIDGDGDSPFDLLLKSATALSSSIFEERVDDGAVDLVEKRAKLNRIGLGNATDKFDSNGNISVSSHGNSTVKKVEKREKHDARNTARTTRCEQHDAQHTPSTDD